MSKRVRLHSENWLTHSADVSQDDSDPFAALSGPPGTEVKYVDYVRSLTVAVAVTGSEADPTSNVNTLSWVPRGSGASQRTGNRVRVVGLEFRATYLAGATGSMLRVLLLLDTQTNGAQFNAEDVLVDTASVIQARNSMRNPLYEQRFVVLLDTMLTPASWAETGGTSTVTGALVYKKELDFVQTFSTVSAGNPITQMRDNSLHVMAIGIATAATFSYVSRVSYVDI